MEDGTNKSGGVSKILFSYFHSLNNDITSRSNKANGFILDSESYNDNLSDKIDKNDYKHLAGTDISSLLYPFSTKVRKQEAIYMPCFESGVTSVPNFKLPSGTISISHISGSGGLINLANILPYYWQNVPSGASFVIDSNFPGASGDGTLSTIRDDTARSESDRFRDPSNIRSVGMRLPMMGVGWGYGSKHCDPYPSGANNSVFRGNVYNGWQVNPDDYIAAPIDFRYDEDRHVWSAPKGFWAEVISSASVSGLIRYSWKEKYQLPRSSGIVLRDHPSRRNGGIFDNPAFDVNNLTVSSGTIVWIEPRERTDSYVFYSGNKKKQFFARLEDSSAVSGYSDTRWEYTWKERLVDSSGHNYFLAFGRNGTKAININEISNTPEPSGANQAWYVCGIDAHGPTFPSGFKLRPIGGGGLDDSFKQFTIVPMNEDTFNSGSGSTLYYWFDRANTFDGMA